MTLQFNVSFVDSSVSYALYCGTMCCYAADGNPKGGKKKAGGADEKPDPGAGSENIAKLFSKATARAAIAAPNR
jgi:hypothetical protein